MDYRGTRLSRRRLIGSFPLPSLAPSLSGGIQEDWERETTWWRERGELDGANSYDGEKPCSTIMHLILSDPTRLLQSGCLHVQDAPIKISLLTLSIRGMYLTYIPTYSVQNTLSKYVNIYGHRGENRANEVKNFFTYLLFVSASARACFVCFEEKAIIVFIFTTGDQNLCCLPMDFLVFNAKIFQHFIGVPYQIQNIMTWKCCH